MLTLKIMGPENKADSEPDKDHRLIGGIQEVRFRRTVATKHEESQLELDAPPQGQAWTVCLAEVKFPEDNVLANYLLNGNCYVLNDDGQTVDTYWPRNKLVDISEAA